MLLQGGGISTPTHTPPTVHTYVMASYLEIMQKLCFRRKHFFLVTLGSLWHDEICSGNLMTFPELRNPFWSAKFFYGGMR